MFHDKSFRMTQNKNNAIFSIIRMAFMGSNYMHDVLQNLEHACLMPFKSRITHEYKRIIHTAVS